MTSSDAVILLVAPVLTHHHLQRAKRILSTDKSSINHALGSAIAAAELPDPLFIIEETNKDIWVQDFFEPEYSSTPGPDGPISIRILIRSFEPIRKAGVRVFTELRAAGIGAVQGHNIPWDQGIDSMGNLETIPPHTINRTRYPAGRITLGGDPVSGKQPFNVPFLRAQEVQDPIILDTAWLGVGHVDEFIQFLPSRNERGWVIMVADPRGRRRSRTPGCEVHQKLRKGRRG